LQLVAILFAAWEAPVTLRQSLTGAAVVAASFLVLIPAAAQQPLSDSEKIDRLERLTEQLQNQVTRQNDLIRELQQGASRTKK
jgi:hypothetical protein